MGGIFQRDRTVLLTRRLGTTWNPSLTVAGWDSGTHDPVSIGQSSLRRGVGEVRITAVFGLETFLIESDWLGCAGLRARQFRFACSENDHSRSKALPFAARQDSSLTRCTSVLGSVTGPGGKWRENSAGVLTGEVGVGQAALRMMRAMEVDAWPARLSRRCFTLSGGVVFQSQ